MELQTLASLTKFSLERFVRGQERISIALPFLCIEDLILIVTLLGAHPDLRSLWIGGAMSVTALLLLFWVQGYQKTRDVHSIIGPFRFVRHPLRLSLWLLAIAFSLGSRSFPGLLISLGLLPGLYQFDMHREELIRRSQSLSSFRYGRFVPALVPTIFPYKIDQNLEGQTFSWRGGIFGIDRSVRRRLGRFILGWILIVLLEHMILPGMAAPIGAGVWLLYLVIRTILHRKTLRLVFT